MGCLKPMGYGEGVNVGGKLNEVTAWGEFLKVSLHAIPVHAGLQL